MDPRALEEPELQGPVVTVGGELGVRGDEKGLAVVKCFLFMTKTLTFIRKAWGAM